MLQGKRIRLRAIVDSDLELLNKWKNQEETYQYLGGGFLPTSVDIQKKWMETLMDMGGRNKRFMIENAAHQAIGMIGLYEINWVHRTCELGIFIGEQEEKGKGFGSEAIALLEDFAADYCNLRKVKVHVVEKNASAVRMYEKSGYAMAGRLTDDRFIKGEYCSVLIMEKMLTAVSASEEK